MRRGLAIICVLSGLAALISATSRSIMSTITMWRAAANPNAWYAIPQYQFAGDLSRMAFLGDFDQYKDTVVYTYEKADKGAARTSLYIWGDSYTKDIPDSAYYGIHRCYFGRRDFTALHYKLDTTRKNLLVFEIGERFIRSHFQDAQPIFKLVRDAGEGQPGAPVVTHYNTKREQEAAEGWQGIFNPYVNQNLEYNLFNYKCFSTIRGWKAGLNALAFNRGSGNVAISEDGRRLFLKSTVLPEGVASAFEPIVVAEQARILRTLDTLYKHYRAQGFDEVYLSIIPNPVTMLQPQGYNGLIPFIQNASRDGRIAMPIIDLYDQLKAKTDIGRYYQRGDTHWSNTGLKLWLRNINQMLHYWDTLQGQPMRLAADSFKAELGPQYFDKYNVYNLDGLEVIALWTGSIRSTSITLDSGRYDLYLTAKGTPLDGIFPKVSVTFEALRKRFQFTPSGAYKDFHGIVELKKKTQVSIVLSLENDAEDKKSGEDRNVFLPSIRFQEKRFVLKPIPGKAGS